MSCSSDPIAALLGAQPVLVTESADTFAALRNAWEQEMAPRGVVEQMYVGEIAALTWEILRLRRCRTGLVNLQFGGSLTELIEQVTERLEGPSSASRTRACDLAQRWFTDSGARDTVTAVLAREQLDTAALEAEAFRRAAQDLELIDRMLASMERRRNTALACIAAWREGLAERLRRGSDRVIEAAALPHVEHAGATAPAD